MKKSVKQTVNASMQNESKIPIKQVSEVKKDNTLMNEKDEMNITQSILNLFEKSTKLQLTPKSLINYFSFGYFLNDQETKIFNKAMVRVDQCLDIQEILYQLQEINKLKTLMLQKNQIIQVIIKVFQCLNILNQFYMIILIGLFLLPKIQFLSEIRMKIIKQNQVKYEEQLPSRLLIEQHLIEDDKEEVNKEFIIKDLYKAWQEIKSDQNQNICQQDINQKLNQELGSEIAQVFQDYVKAQNIHITQKIEDKQLIQPQIE